jgi:protein-disulfide isomerase
MNRRRWLIVLAIAVWMLAALPALAQEAESTAQPLDGLWNFLGITSDQLQAVEQPAASDDPGALLASLPQWRTEDGAFVVGDENAPFTLIEFADWACPHCLTYEADTIQPFIRDYVATGQANFEFRPFPTAGRDTTVAAAQLAECAETLVPGGFWTSYATYYEMTNAGLWDVDTIIRALTSRLDVSRDDLVNCVVNWEQNSDQPMQIQTDYEFAVAANIGGTPSALVRFNGGEAEVLVWEGATFDQGGIPLDVLSAVVASVQPQ